MIERLITTLCLIVAMPVIVACFAMLVVGCVLQSVREAWR